jgi:hypothetical protein
MGLDGSTYVGVNDLPDRGFINCISFRRLMSSVSSSVSSTCFLLKETFDGAAPLRIITLAVRLIEGEGSKQRGGAVASCRTC